MSSLPSKMKAAVIEQTGGVEQMSVKEVPLPSLAEDQVLIKTEFAGINFIDTYHRQGLYPIKMPFTIGVEVAGTVVDSKSSDFKNGDNVVSYLTGLGGGYAQYSAANAKKVAKIPDGVSLKNACASTLQGLTAITAYRESVQPNKGDYIYVPAAAGGLGLLLCQMGKALGLHVIGSTSTPEKADLAKKNGAEHVVLYKDRDMMDVAQDVIDLTDDKEGVHASIDGVGKDTFEANFKLLRRNLGNAEPISSLQLTVDKLSIGNASGAAPPIAPLRLAEKNLKLMRSKLDNNVYTKEEFQHYSEEVFKMLANKEIAVAIHKEYPLTTEGVRQAHSDIASRVTSGKLLIKI